MNLPPPRRRTPCSLACVFPAASPDPWINRNDSKRSKGCRSRGSPAPGRGRHDVSRRRPTGARGRRRGAHGGPGRLVQHAHRPGPVARLLLALVPARHRAQLRPRQQLGHPAALERPAPLATRCSASSPRAASSTAAASPPGTSPRTRTDSTCSSRCSSPATAASRRASTCPTPRTGRAGRPPKCCGSGTTTRTRGACACTGAGSTRRICYLEQDEGPFDLIASDDGVDWHRHARHSCPPSPPLHRGVRPVLVSRRRVLVHRALPRAGLDVLGLTLHTRAGRETSISGCAATPRRSAPRGTRSTWRAASPRRGIPTAPPGCTGWSAGGRSWCSRCRPAGTAPIQG